MALRLANCLKRIAAHVHLAPEDPERAAIRAWFAINGDRTLRLDYELTPDSIVFDVGGYQGQWSSDIFSRFLCFIHIFEPISEHASQIKRRFALNSKVIVNEFGLGGSDREELMKPNAESSSAVRFVDREGARPVKFMSMRSYMSASGVQAVDLLKINIEGMEYELLNHLLDEHLIEAFKNIQVQFHSFAPDAESGMRDIQARLSRTHHLTYQFPFVWENWTINV
jgi:FkbM family methyltransferase